MSLSAGTNLGPYRIVSKLGTGGMGEVYKARDTRLEREVAVKILPEQLSQDPEWNRRFEQEARAISALNHPHICTLHDVGPGYLVMEYIDGTPIRGPMPLPEAVRLAAQIADALDVAHGKGITHRDLKPDNVLLTKAGVKLLDFGIARVRPVGDLHGDARTISQELTREGAILGTPRYMAPEQLEGKQVDHRSDIFAFGCVLYEMITGKRVFDGTSGVTVVASILAADPAPFSQVRPEAPAALGHLIDRCLARDPEKRWQTARDLKAELEWISKLLSGPTEPARPRRRRDAVFLAIGAVLALAIMSGLWLQSSPATPQPPLRRFTIAPDIVVTDAVISPDGRHVAMTTGQRLFVQDLDQDHPRRIVDDEGIAGLCWSPGSDFIAFVKWRVVLKKVSVHGGPVVTLWQLPGGAVDRPTWSPDGKAVVFSSGISSPLYEVPAEGGAAKVLLQVQSSESRDTLQDPHFLRSGNTGRTLLLAQGTAGTPQIVAQDLESGKREVLGPGLRPVYSQTGHIVYETAGDLWAMPFSANSLHRAGESFPIQRSACCPSVSADGSLVYLGTTGGLQQLVWKDRKGAKVGFIGQPQRRAQAPNLTPDGTRVGAVGGEDTLQLDIWIHDVTRGSRTRLTSHPANDYRPVWRGAGMFAFASDRGGSTDIFFQNADGSGEAKVLVATADNDFPHDWSDDGKYLIYSRCSRGQCDLWSLRYKEGQGAFEETPFIHSPFDEGSADFSPDGRFVVYSSDDSGRNEVYVQRFPDGTEKRQISTKGGANPRWRADGKELFYLEGTTLIAVPVSTTPDFKFGTATRLFEDKEAFTGRGRPYDVSPDGRRFVLPETLEQARQTIRIVQNWFGPFRSRQ